MANIYLNPNDSDYPIGHTGDFVYGQTGTEDIVIAAGVTGIVTDQNVEQVQLAGAAADFTYQQQGNQLLVFTGGVLTATIPLQSDTDGTQLVLTDGSFSAVLTDGVMTLGGTTVPADTAGPVVPGSGGSTFTLTADAASVDEGSTATFTVTGDSTHSAGDTVNYTLTGVDSADVTGGMLTGTATLGADLTATISVDLSADLTTEGTETLTVTLTGGATASTTVNDTSIEPVQGQVITLTNGIDIKDGTEGADIFDGLVNAQGVATLNSSDILDGKEGDDKLVAEINAATTIATTTKNIENIELIATAAGTFDTINTADVKSITIKNSVAANILTVSNIASTDIAVTQLNQSGDITLNYANTALSGINNLAITLSGAQSDVSGGGDLRIVQQAGTDTSGAETVTLASVGTNSNFLDSLTSVDGSAVPVSKITTLNVTGEQSLTIDTGLNASVNTVDASGLTAGGLTASFGNTASNMVVKGGAGNDNITLTANAGAVNATMGAGNDTFTTTNAGGFNTLDVIAGGEGTDTLGMASADAEAINAALTNVSGFEGLTLNTAVTAGGTVNATFFGDIATTNFTAANGINGAFGLTMAAGSKTVNIGNGTAGTGALTNVGTLTVTDTGTAVDDVLTVNNTNTAGALDALSGSITSNGYETVNINTGSVVTAVQNLNVVTINADSVTNANTLNFTGVNSVALAGAVSNGSGNFTIDASGLTGLATLVMTAAASHSGGVTGTTVITGSNMASTAAGLGDTLLGNATAANTINAGAANDTVTGGAVIDTIDLGAGNDTLNASTGNDVVTGGDGNDTMTAGVGEQTLKGDAGNDTIIAGATVSANDVFTGGDGTDTLSISAAVLAANAAGISGFETLALAGGNVIQDMIQFTNNSGFVTAAVGSAHSFTFNNAGSAFNTLQVTDFVAGAGAEVVTAATVARLVDTSADTLTINSAGTASALVNAGASTIATVTANDEETININGGELASEDMTITTLNANDVKSMTLTGAGDVIITNLIGGAANLSTVDASAVVGAVTVNAGNSTANMTMTGSTTGSNTFTAGTGADTIVGGAAADSITAGNGNDTINAGAGNDATVLGGLGNDTIDGGTGDDTITGGVGADTLTGGLGADIFVYSKGDGSGAGKGTGADSITDFVTGTDKIDVTNGVLNGITNVTQTVASAANTLALADDNVFYLSINGAAANLTTGGGATLTATDLTASSLTNVAAYLSEQFTAISTGGAGADSVFVINWTAGGSSKSYVYNHIEDNTAGIAANELSLLGVVERGSLATDILVAGDVQ